MVKNSQRAEINTFVQGIITEASPLNFPPNATKDEQNFEATRYGLRERRLGIDFEIGFDLIDSGFTISELDSRGLNTFLWEGVGGDSEKEYLVIQIGNFLQVFDTRVDSISSDGFIDSLVLTGYPIDARYSFASVDGNLVVAAGQDTVAVVTLDSGTNTFSFQNKSIRVRDLWGVEVTGSDYETDTRYRDNVLNEKHIYNLRNQSWGGQRNTPTAREDDPIRHYRSTLSLFPSNSETVWPGMVFRGDTDTPRERFDARLIRDVFGADTSPSKGYFIIDLLKRGSSRLEEVQKNQSNFPSLQYPVSSLPEDRTPRGATVVAEFAGRAWFGGFGGEVVDGDSRSPDLTSYVAFSQLVTLPEDIFKCYQQGDPSSRDSSDIVDTDGGFVRISGATGIRAMVSTGRELIVLCKNGVWSISGSANEPFTATSYEAKKLTSFGCIGDKSIVLEGDRVFYWAEDGIYVIQRNQFGDLEVANITKDTIKSLYEDIPSIEREKVSAVYDPYERKIRWLYVDSNGNFTELILDTELSAFYKNRIYLPEDGTYTVRGSFKGTPFLRGVSRVEVVVEGELVEVEAEDVIISTEENRSGVRSIRYLTVIDVAGEAFYTFSLYRNPKFIDFPQHSSGGNDAYAFMLTGAVTGGDSGIHKQVPYLVTHFQRTEVNVLNEEPDNQSSCLIRSQWDWASSATSGKWGDAFQAYRYRRPYFVSGPADIYDNGFETVVTKNKIRGRGRAFSFFLETEPAKDCRILGWAIDVNGNSKT